MIFPDRQNGDEVVSCSSNCSTKKFTLHVNFFQYGEKRFYFETNPDLKDGFVTTDALTNWFIP